MNDGKEEICRYSAAGRFKSAELNYPFAQKEILSAKKCFESFALFLRPVEFTLRTDLNNFMGFFASKNIKKMQNGRMIRWAAFFSSWKFKAKHIKGSKTCVADMLTREGAEKKNDGE